MTTYDFNVWTLAVDSLCREKLACSWADLCGERQPLCDGFSAGMPPGEQTDPTRPPSFYNSTFNYLAGLGIPILKT